MNERMTDNLMPDVDYLDEAKHHLKAALTHSGEKVGGYTQLARAEALVSIAQDLRYILGTIRDEGVVTKRKMRTKQSSNFTG